MYKSERKKLIEDLKNQLKVHRENLKSDKKG